MCWPARTNVSAAPTASLRAKQAYARVARAISGFEPVMLAARPIDAAEARLATGGKVDVVEMALDDSWARDFGPTFLTATEGRLAGVHWIFNAWGRKYHPYTNDATFARRVLEAAGGALYRGAARLRRRRASFGRGGDRAHHRAMPAQSEPQSRDVRVPTSRTC